MMSQQSTDQIAGPLLATALQLSCCFSKYVDHPRSMLLHVCLINFLIVTLFDETEMVKKSVQPKPYTCVWSLPFTTVSEAAGYVIQINKSYCLPIP